MALRELPGDWQRHFDVPRHEGVDEGVHLAEVRYPQQRWDVVLVVMLTIMSQARRLELEESAVG